MNKETDSYMWVRIDDRAPEHPKLVRAGVEACWLWVCGLAYCNRQKAHDGRIPKQLAPILFPGLLDAPGAVSRLVSVGLWDDDGDSYQVHDYLEHQQTKEWWEELSKRRAEAGRKGGLARNNGKALTAKERKQRYKARQLYTRAVARGELIRGNCEVCGADKNVEGHHDDYSKPLEVRWLCTEHHSEIHTSSKTSNEQAVPDPVPVPNKDHLQIVSAWFAAYEQLHGSKPVMNARNGKAAKDLLKAVGLPVSLRAIENAFSDDWFRKSSCDLWLIYNGVNKYARDATSLPVSQSALYRPAKDPY